jgi:hypothetical protein
MLVKGTSPPPHPIPSHHVTPHHTTSPHLAVCQQLRRHGQRRQQRQDEPRALYRGGLECLVGGLSQERRREGGGIAGDGTRAVRVAAAAQRLPAAQRRRAPAARRPCPSHRKPASRRHAGDLHAADRQKSLSSGGRPAAAHLGIARLQRGAQRALEPHQLRQRRVRLCRRCCSRASGAGSGAAVGHRGGGPQAQALRAGLRLPPGGQRLPGQHGGQPRAQQRPGRQRPAWRGAARRRSGRAGQWVPCAGLMGRRCSVPLETPAEVRHGLRRSARQPAPHAHGTHTRQPAPHAPKHACRSMPRAAPCRRTRSASSSASQPPSSPSPPPAAAPRAGAAAGKPTATSALACGGAAARRRDPRHSCPSRQGHSRGSGQGG